MPTNPTLPTLAQALGEVKKLCSYSYSEGRYTCDPGKIARAQQAAVTKALRWAVELLRRQNARFAFAEAARIEDAADAIEKELTEK